MNRDVFFNGEVFVYIKVFTDVHIFAYTTRTADIEAGILQARLIEDKIIAGARGCSTNLYHPGVVGGQVSNATSSQAINPNAAGVSSQVQRISRGRCADAHLHASTRHQVARRS